MPLSNEDRIQKLLNRLSKPAKVDYDSSKFNDPIADQTEWGPCFPGGANYRTRRLVAVRPNRLEFRAGCTSKFFGLIFLLMGLLVGGLFSMLLIVPEFRDWQTYLPIAGSLLFVAVGIFFLRYGNKPIVFDKDSGYYWYSRKDPMKVVNLDEISSLQKLSDIHALQLIPERMSGSGTTSTGGYSSGSYMSYEINLILKDASRVNVIDHGDLGQIMIDVEQLSKFLNVPIWNALDQDG